MSVFPLAERSTPSTERQAVFPASTSIDGSCSQPTKAEVPIFVTPAGISIEVSEEQYRKA